MCVSVCVCVRACVWVSALLDILLPLASFLSVFANIKHCHTYICLWWVSLLDVALI